MEAYTDFAKVYDTFMDETPYTEWCDLIDTLLKRYGSVDEVPEDENLKQEKNTILDLGCGTGTLTELLCKKGYDMIGIDNSQEMLQIAMEKKADSDSDILYLLQDMRDFELYGTVGAVISVCDSLNYLLNEEDVLSTFRLVNNYLYPDGLFIFDFNTVYKYEVVIGDSTIAENRENCSFIWENYYHAEDEINEYDLTLFVRNDRFEAKVSNIELTSAEADKRGNNKNNEKGENIFYRFEETHYQRGYRLEQMKSLLEKAGMEFITAFDADTHEEVLPESERIYIIAREQGK